MHIASDQGGASVLPGAAVDYDRLKREAQASPRQRSRQILVPGFDMVICLTCDSYVQMHRHPQYEAYHVIEGRLLVETEGGVELYEKHRPYVCLPPMTWHRPSTDSRFVIYREFYCGPFEKARDVEYHPDKMKEAA